MGRYYVYMLANKRNGTIYIGMTNDLERRMREHKQGEAGGFCKKYGISQLVYFERHNSNQDAFKRERRLKKWRREWKIELIEEKNPQWKDLALDWE